MTDCDACAGRLPDRIRDRGQLLLNLAVGDIFHAVSPKAPSLVLLVVAVTETKIDARNICTQDRLSFDRASGIAGWTDERLFGTDQPVTCTIDSVAPLPVDVHNVLIGLDRKFRLEHDWERIKLTDAEVRALSYVQHHYAANPL